jgi:hypothetical protein
MEMTSKTASQKVAPANRKTHRDAATRGFARENRVLKMAALERGTWENLIAISGRTFIAKGIF